MIEEWIRNTQCKSEMHLIIRTYTSSLTRKAFNAAFPARLHDLKFSTSPNPSQLMPSFFQCFFNAWATATSLVLPPTAICQKFTLLQTLADTKSLLHTTLPPLSTMVPTSKSRRTLGAPSKTLPSAALTDI